MAGVSETEVRQRLALKEEQEQAQLGSEGPDHCISTKFLLFGLDLERKQYVSLFSLNSTADILRDGNYVYSSHNMARLSFQPTSSNNAQSYVVSSPSFVNLSGCINRNLASSPPPLMTMSSTFLCTFLPPSQMTPELSALASWS